MLKITEIVSGIHVKDYRDCIRDTCKRLQRLYQGYMLKITEIVSGIHTKEYSSVLSELIEIKYY